MANNQVLLLSLLATTFALAIAFEPSPLQDFCVADPASSGKDKWNCHWSSATLNKLSLASHLFAFCDKWVTF